MDVGGLSVDLGDPGQLPGVLHLEDGDADVHGNRSGVAVHRGMAQDQDGLIQPGLPQFRGFCQRADAEKGAIVLNMTGHLHRAVAIGIGFDHRHDLGAGLFVDRTKVMPNGVQIDLDISIIAAQDIISLQNHSGKAQ